VYTKKIIFSILNKIIKNRNMNKIVKLTTSMLAIIVFAVALVSCDRKDEPLPEEIISVMVEPGTLDLTIGDKQTLTATLSPDLPQAAAVKWSSNDAGIVTVNSTGRLTGEVLAIAAGTATITVTTANNKTATCEVTVQESTGGTISITLAPVELNLYAGEKQTLTATISPELPDAVLEWSSDNEGIATVNPAGNRTAEVTARAAGTTTITVTTADNQTATCEVRVGTITLAPVELNLYAGEKQTLTATISPELPVAVLKWSSNNEGIATVSPAGNRTAEVTARAAGTAIITVTTTDNKTATCEVRVGIILGELEQEGEIPVIAFGGAPLTELKPAGFDMCWTWTNIRAVTNQLNQAAEAGVKIWFDYGSLNTDAQTAVNNLKGHPGFAGYIIRDEPSVNDFDRLNTLVEEIREFDTESYCYINLFPNYATTGQLGTSSYVDYLETFARIPTGSISFDHYPANGRGHVNPNWYSNLEDVRNVANKYNTPFWSYVLSTRASAGEPDFTLGELSLQVYASLAYGSQAIQYFVFSGGTTDAYPYFKTPLSDGRRTVTYDYAKKINFDVKRLSHIFSRSKVLNVWHTGINIPVGTVRLQEDNPPEMPPIKSLKTSNGGAVVSLIEKDNKHYLVIVNHDYMNPMSLTITIDDSVKKVRKSGIIMTANSETINVEPGDVAIYMWDN
jgi:uncharacterized protein YjdB